MKQAKQNIIRLYKYRDILNRLKPLGCKKIFSDDLADYAGVEATQVRKDFSIFGLFGNKKAGYDVEDLIIQLNKLLGKNDVQKVIIVGAGNIGRALMHYDGFNKEGIEIAGIFDIDPMKKNLTAKPPIFPLESLFDFIKKNKVEIGVIAVPYSAAQQILDLLILAGIKGVLNFAPVNLKAPKDFFINDVNVRGELETVGYFVNALKKEKELRENR